jgi:two-component system CheB/CheR fusion protein
MAKAATKKKTPKSKPYPIVAIGASAGGLEAVTELLENLSPDTGMAFVYVQHLTPDRKSMLTEILQRKTSMKVFEAAHLMKIEPNHLFIIPPNKDMAIVDGVVTLNPRQTKPFHTSVDKFFTSLAEKQREGAIGVVLSGNAHDGTYGLRSIKMAGGITFAQDQTAKFPSMPQSAISAGVVDMIRSPKEIAKELERISKHPAIPHIIQETDGEYPKSDEDDKALFQIIQLIKKATNVDFTHYKINTIKRRIIRRMLIYKIDTLVDYLTYLKQHPNEVSILYNDVLINVTSFFRDADSLEYVKKTLLPKILESKQPNEPLRIWVPACATGEESYSLAMICMEALEDNTTGSRIQIFATDLSESCIAKARMGLYKEHELEGLSPERFKKFFEKTDGSYRIIKSIRDMCVFATHNVFKDPPFSKLDLISCCNLMIYLDSELQKKLISIFHYALKSNGYLILGKSETITNSPQLFTQLEKKYKIFISRKEERTFPNFEMHYHFRDIEHVQSRISRKSFPKTEGGFADIDKLIQSFLLREFSPPSVLVNANLEILQFHGSTGSYLEPSQGKASLNLLKMARPGLGYDLRTVVHKAMKSGKREKKQGVDVHQKNGSLQVNIEVVPINAEPENPLFLVVFDEVKESPHITGRKEALSKDKLVRQLQEELNIAKEDMRSIIEDQEASVEELQSANEEIISSNEELQSINEELETSKEEVESSNEELLTINNELQIRNEQLSESYEYSQAIFETISEAVLVLDKDFRVKSANEAFYKIFQVSEKDTEGVLIYDLGNKQWNILKLRELLDSVVGSYSPFLGFEMSHEFPGIGQKTMVLGARRIDQKTHRQELIILTIQDITEHRRAEKIIAAEEARFRNMANNAPVMVWTIDTNKKCNFINNTWRQFTGTTDETDLPKLWLDDLHPADREARMKILNANFENKQPFKVEYRLKYADGGYRWVSELGEPYFSPEGEFIGYIGSCTEIHDKKLAQEEMERLVEQRTKDLKEAIEDLNHTNTELSQFAYVASHDLQEPLRKIITYTDRLLVKHGDWSASDQESLDKIIHSAERMRKLINDLLSFSKTSRPGKQFEMADLNQIMNEVVHDLDLFIEEKKAKIDYHDLPVLPVIPFQVKQMFYNLISNSLKFSTDSRNPEITITAEKLDGKKKAAYQGLDAKATYYEIVITDNGIGFEQEFADQVFTLFKRLDSVGKYQGSGVGLALCRKIVANHKGMIFAESKPGMGASFHIILPAAH